MTMGPAFFNFLVISFFVFAVGGAMYWYAKKIGQGDVRAAFEDPADRKRIYIVWAFIIGLAGLIFAMLVISGALKL